MGSPLSIQPFTRTTESPCGLPKTLNPIWARRTLNSQSYRYFCHYAVSTFRLLCVAYLTVFLFAILLFCLIVISPFRYFAILPLLPLCHFCHLCHLCHFCHFSHFCHVCHLCHFCHFGRFCRFRRFCCCMAEKHLPCFRHLATPGCPLTGGWVGWQAILADLDSMSAAMVQSEGSERAPPPPPPTPQTASYAQVPPPPHCCPPG